MRRIIDLAITGGVVLGLFFYYDFIAAVVAFLFGMWNFFFDGWTRAMSLFEFAKLVEKME